MEGLPFPTLVYNPTGPQQNRDSRMTELQLSLVPLQRHPTPSKGWATSGF